MNTARLPRRVELHEFAPGAHAELLESWLKRPHVIRRWGEQSENLGVFLRRSPSSHAVIVADGSPVGYLCWGKPPAEELTAAGLTDLPDDLVDIDILIGEPQCVGRGIGPRALCALLDQLSQQVDVRWAGVGTSRSNHAAISAFERAGFRLFREFDDPDCGPCRYMVIELRQAV